MYDYGLNLLRDEPPTISHMRVPIQPIRMTVRWVYLIGSWRGGGGTQLFNTVIKTKKNDKYKDMYTFPVCNKSIGIQNTSYNFESRSCIALQRSHIEKPDSEHRLGHIRIHPEIKTLT